jgi:hypothetical protein
MDPALQYSTNALARAIKLILAIRLRVPVSLRDHGGAELVLLTEADVVTMSGKAVVYGRLAGLVCVAAAFWSGPCEAGWRHYWALPPRAEYVFPPPIVEYVGPFPPVIIYEPAHVYGARPYGIVRYNRPCLVSDGRSSYAVSCLSLAAYGFIPAYNGE